LQPGMLKLQRGIKQAIDPEGIFGPHRLHDSF